MDRQQTRILMFCLGGALLNIALNFVNRALLSPLFFDSVLTAVVSATLGLWPGLITAFFTQLGMEVVVSAEGAAGTAMPFVFCGFATSLIVASMAATGNFRSLLHLVLAIASVTLANAVLGSIVATFVFGGRTLHASDTIVETLIRVGQSLFESAFWARVPINLVDKGLAVSLAFFVLSWVKPVEPSALQGSR